MVRRLLRFLELGVYTGIVFGLIALGVFLYMEG